MRVPNVDTNRLVVRVNEQFPILVLTHVQTSIVILSHLAYPSLFYTLVSKLAPSFMTHGGPMLEAACHNVANWCVKNMLSICIA